MGTIISGTTYMLTAYPRTCISVRMRVRRRGKTMCFLREI